MFFAGFALILGFWPVRLDNRPKLQIEALMIPLSRPDASARCMRTRKSNRWIFYS